MDISFVDVKIAISPEHRKYIAMSRFEPYGQLATNGDIEEFVQLLFIMEMNKRRKAEREGQFNDCDKCNLDMPLCNKPCVGS